MSEKEMKKELNINYNEINIIENLQKVNELIKYNNILPPNIKYIYGIEGLDYLEKLEDIEKIYDLGVRSITPLWNNDNKYGGGLKGDKNKGLTDEGKKLINKLVKTNIAIDLSHSNEKTFYNIIDECKNLKEQGLDPIVFASHSNVKKICNIERNLSDNQILEIKSLDGIIGVVEVKEFCRKEKVKNKLNKEKYIEHINYLKNLLGNVENIAIATDDMSYYNTNKRYYRKFNTFKQCKIKKELEKMLLKNSFSKDEVQKILYKNAREKILNRLN